MNEREREWLCVCALSARPTLIYHDRLDGTVLNGLPHDPGAELKGKVAVLVLG